MRAFSPQAFRTLLRQSPAAHLFKRPSTPQTFFTPLRTVRTTTTRASAPLARNGFSRWTIRASAAAAAGLTTFTLLSFHPAHAEAPPDIIDNTPAHADSRKIRLAEVGKHGKDAEAVWIIRGNRVYDITDWVPNHPGGDVILRAAGGSVDPFWKIFTIHQKQDVYDILEQYFIGVIDDRDLEDGQVPNQSIDDPFKDDPARHGCLTQHTARPCNAETPADRLTDYITPNELFYVRNHMWVPTETAEEHQLVIELPDGEEATYSIEELRKKFKPHTVTAVLQCSGNRRSHMTAESGKKASGLPWGVGAIGNAEWTGVLLRDVFKDMGLALDDLPNEDVQHVQFVGSEAYAASIPIDKAIDKRGDVLLAYEMNGEELPRDHGYPLRALVPGTVAARSVKWLNKIILSDEESPSQWQRRDYKCFGPNAGDKPDWDSAPSIQETPVQSAITSIRAVPVSDSPLDSAEKAETAITLEGYAYSGGGRRVIRVDVSSDNGVTWDQAELLPYSSQEKGSKSWSWQKWKFTMPESQVGEVFCVKATDDSYNTQPSCYKSNYNHRGNLTTAWQRVPYKKGAEEIEI